MAKHVPFDWDKLHQEMVALDMLPTDLNPGIVKTVIWLQLHGFETVDSGDGETHMCVCDNDYPYVVMRVEPDDLVDEVDRLYALLDLAGISLEYPIDETSETIEEAEAVVAKQRRVEGSYEPVSRTAYIMLVNVTDALLTEEGRSLPMPWPVPDQWSDWLVD